MVEKVKDEMIRWLARHSKEVRVRLALGHSKSAIAGAFGCTRETVTRHIELESLDTPLSWFEVQSFAAEVETDKVIEEVFDAERGSVVQARLRASLAALCKASSALIHVEETGMKSVKEIGEMGEDELRNYVASLVPGLEVKHARPPDRAAARSDGALSVSANGTAGAKAAKTGNRMA